MCHGPTNLDYIKDSRTTCATGRLWDMLPLNFEF